MVRSPRRLPRSGAATLLLSVLLATMLCLSPSLAVAQERAVALDKPRLAQAPEPYWDAGRWGYAFATLLMWLGSVLFVGSLRRNPALPRPGKKIERIDEPNGVYSITRHPMMWGFALWAATHAIVNPTAASLILTSAIAFLALVGAALQDGKKDRLMGQVWSDYRSKTSFVPYGNGLKSADGFALMFGTLLWLGATWAHGALGGMPAGVWAFLG